MSRDVPFKEDKICDDCGKAGAYDFYGDYCCPECLDEWMASWPPIEGDEG